MDFVSVRQMLNREFPELVARLEGEQKKVIKRRPGAAP
jgi:hypothetical protein